jgi:hypothetical protein
MEHTLSQFIPKIGEDLALYKGKEVLERIGENIVKEVVISILCGGNVRSLTEGLTRRRLALSNASLLVTFLNAYKHIDNFLENMPKLVKQELLSTISPEKKIFLQWFVGLTGKSIQNVLRNEDKEFEKYLETIEDALRKSIESCQIDFGALTGTLQLNEVECAVDWPFILYLFTAIGAQTLSIRGSEKSLYGKMFEKLILGSLLTLLGFQLIDPEDRSRHQKVFWLSSRGDKRESDATVLYKPGVGVRFDIGFIGPGNTEISLDKVSRFEREMEHGRQIHYMSTIIIVDRIGEKSRIVEMAKAIDGDLVQMSMAYWVKDVCRILRERIHYNHEILKVPDKKFNAYIEERILPIRFELFL